MLRAAEAVKLCRAAADGPIRSREFGDKKSPKWGITPNKGRVGLVGRGVLPSASGAVGSAYALFFFGLKTQSSSRSISCAVEAGILPASEGGILPLGMRAPLAWRGLEARRTGFSEDRVNETGGSVRILIGDRWVSAFPGLEAFPGGLRDHRLHSDPSFIIAAIRVDFYALLFFGPKTGWEQRKVLGETESFFSSALLREFRLRLGRRSLSMSHNEH